MHKAMERWDEDPVTVCSDLGLENDEPDQFMRGCLFRQKSIDAIFGSDAKLSTTIEERAGMSMDGDGKTICTGKPDFMAGVDGVYYIEDFKAGRVRVEDIASNQQLQVLAAILLVNHPGKVKRIFISVNQPYAPSTAQFVEIDPSQFAKLVKKISTGAVRAIQSLNEGHCAGEWCRYCKAASVCPISQAIIKRMAEFRDIISNLSRNDLGKLLDAAEMAKKLIPNIESEALNRAARGDIPDGWELETKSVRLTEVGKLPKSLRVIADQFIDSEEKTVQKRSVRDEEGMLKALRASGLDIVSETKLTSTLKRKI
jgi:hypothetical protein